MKAAHQLSERGCYGGRERMQHDRRSVARAGRQPDSIITPPNSSIMFAQCAAIPLLTAEIAQGESWLCCAVSASGQQKKYTAIPQLQINDNQVVIREPESARQLSFFL